MLRYETVLLLIAAFLDTNCAEEIIGCPVFLTIWKNYEIYNDIDLISIFSTGSCFLP